MLATFTDQAVTNNIPPVPTPVPTAPPAPTVSGITPSSGQNATSISITNLAGTGFTSSLGGTTVKLTKTGQADIAATGVTVASATQINCTFDLTGKTIGLWNVVVTNPDGQTATLANGFTITYVSIPAPTITGITPSSGQNTTSIGITNLAGTGFLTGATVKLTKTGQTDIAATSVTVVSATQINCTVNLTGKTVGPWNVVVTNTDTQTGTLTNGFTVTSVSIPAPTITGITPSSGQNTTSISITNLTGTGFLTGATVKLTKTNQTDISATSVTVVSATQINCTVNLTGKIAGQWNIVVTNTDTQTGTLTNGFTVTSVSTSAPTVTGLSPATGTTLGGTSVTINGTNFLGATSVKFGTTEASSKTIVSDSSITATSPAGTAGIVNVTVTTPSGTSATSTSSQYTYRAVTTATAVGVFRSGTFYLNGGTPVAYGLATDTPITGDWNGDRATEVGVWRSGTFYLNGGTPVAYGLSTDKPITGDWNGDGTTEVGVFRSGTFYLNGGTPVAYGLATDTPITGDWNGDGTTEVGVYRSGMFYLNGGTTVRSFGMAGDRPITGDWRGDGTTEVGVWRSGTFYEYNANTLVYGLATDTPITGTWV